MARLAAIQYRPPKAQPDAARAGLFALVDEAGGHGADLIVAPEMATSGYVFASPDALDGIAEPALGPTFEGLQSLARTHAAIIAVGYPERDGDALYNSMLVVGADGELIANYRKNLLYDLDETWAQPGSERVFAKTPLGRLVPSICMDLNDDGFITFSRLMRPDIIPFSTNWLDQGFDVRPYWRHRLRGVGTWLVAANTWGSDCGVRFRGESAILGPSGRVFAAADRTGDAIVMANTERDT